MKHWLCVWSVGIVSGCASDKPSPDVLPQLQAYVMCLHRWTATYDDRKAAPVTVGLLINNACRAEFLSWVQAEAKNLRPDERQQFQAGMERRGIELATQVVTKRRAASG